MSQNCDKMHVALLANRLSEHNRLHLCMDYTPFAFAGGDNSPPFVDDAPDIRITDLQHGAAQEHGKTLADILERRTGLLWRRSLTEVEISRAAEDDSITNEESMAIRKIWEALKGYTEGFVSCCEEGDFEKIRHPPKLDV